MSQPDYPPDVRVHKENLAYAICTSGSTGKPKGVMISHSGLCRVMGEQKDKFYLDANCRTLQFASPSFDACSAEVFATLLSGATLCLAPHMQLYPGPNLAKFIREKSITTVTLPPSALAVMSTEGTETLETVVSAGEACSESVIARWSPGRRFINAYGPTEATICATISTPFGPDSTAVIGRAIEGAVIHILDKRLQQLGIGHPGQLYIGGTTLARGYLNGPDLTADNFIPNPFSAEPGSRLYRTGDFGYYLPDGEIVFLGRSDHQVKLRGFRVELGEIEAALRAHRDVEDCVVLMQEEMKDDKMLVAYCTNAGLKDASVSDLRHHLRERLPEYMVPSRFCFLKDLPRTPNGKIDRSGLSKYEVTRPQGATYLPPRNEAERVIADVWAEVLQIKEIGMFDNFFDIGGHSLRMIMVHGRLKSRFQTQIPFVDLFIYPTVASLAAHIAAGETQATSFGNEKQRAEKSIASLRRARSAHLARKGQNI